MTTAAHDDNQVHRVRLALLVTVLDGQCDDRAHDLLCDPAHPHLAVEVAHRLAHCVVDLVDECDHAEMRADIAAELLKLADEGGDEAAGEPDQVEGDGA